ncbi:MAG TPA: hypothetical protein VN436_09520, partial [Holophaga sp.]|nr:hypothetical protein [Holophaga sp.]
VPEAASPPRLSSWSGSPWSCSQASVFSVSGPADRTVDPRRVKPNTLAEHEEPAMAPRKLTREEIALSILNGVISSLAQQCSGGAIDYLHEENILSPHIRQNACILAFQMADLFIAERDRTPGSDPSAPRHG